MTPEDRGDLAIVLAFVGMFVLLVAFGTCIAWYVVQFLEMKP